MWRKAAYYIDGRQIGLRNAEKNCILHILTGKGIGKPRLPTFEPPY
jgi:hypothetical protein